MKFKVAIEETVSQVFEVEAETAEEAMETAEKNYRNGKFVLEPGELTSKQMSIVEPESAVTEWTEF